ncbi:hypothetical protein CSA57_06830 [candidate division KSB3 bacterium]|nr:MAG: hypothetical protein CSA57_06830 [candidate division KSB3 bacterium]
MKSTFKRFGFYFSEWLTVVIVYSLLILFFASRAYIFTTYNREISWLIVLLFFLGALMLLLHLRSLYREDRALSEVGQQIPSFKMDLSRLLKNRPTLSAENFADNLRQTVDKHFSHRKKSLIKTRIYHIAGMALSGTAREQGTLSLLLQQQSEVKGSRVHYISGILIMIGLLGTFLGLVQSVQYLQNFFVTTPSVDFNSLFADMKNTLGGLDRAFGTSIGGITAYLVLGYLNVVFKAKQAYVLHQVENMTVEELVPTFSTIYQECTKDPSSNAADVLQTLPDRVAGELGRSLETVIHQTIGGSSENLKATGLYLQQAAEGILAGQQSFRETLTAFAEFFTGFQEGRAQLVDSQQSISEGVQRFSQALAHLEKNQNMLTESLNMTREYFEHSETRLCGMDETIHKMHKVWQDNNTLFEQFVKTIQQEHAMLSQTTEGLQEMLQSVKTDSREFFQVAQQHIQRPIEKNTDVHERLLESHTLLSSLLHDMKHFLMDEQNGLRLLSASMDETFGNAKLQYFQLVEYVEALHTRLRENHAQLAQVQETASAIQQQLQSRRGA